MICKGGFTRERQLIKTEEEKTQKGKAAAMRISMVCLACGGRQGHSWWLKSYLHKLPLVLKVLTLLTITELCHPTSCPGLGFFYISSNSYLKLK